MNISMFDLASRFIGMKEVQGPTANPLILGMLKLDDTWPNNDEVPWCSAFMNFLAWQLRLPRSKSLAARSWLAVGKPIPLRTAQVGYDVVILKRGSGAQPGADVIAAPGHVGLFAGYSDDGRTVSILAGNQGDSVSVAPFHIDRVLGVRRLV